MAIQADGKVVAVGYAHDGSNNDIALVRYNANGTLDTTFGIGGKVTTDLSGDEYALGIEIQSDDKIVVAGYSNYIGNNDFAVARYLAGEVLRGSDNANLSSLTAQSSPDGNNFSALPLTPAFAAATIGYTATVPDSVTSARLTPTVEDTGKATMALVSVSPSVSISPGAFVDVALGVGDNVITIRVTAENGATKDYIVTITRAAPTVSLNASPNPVSEGSAVTITATLTAALSTDVTIPLTIAAGNTNPAESGDYGALASITVAAGQTTGTGTITTNHDTGEDDETFIVSLGTLPTSVLEGSMSSVEVTIADDEGTPAVTLSASPNPVTEGSSVTVTATLSKVLTSAVTIPLTTAAGNPNPAESGDYSTLASIRIAAGQTTGTGTIRANHDTDTDDETFTVSLGTLPTGVREGSVTSVEVTIGDDDKATVTLEASPNPVDEGSAVTITARLSKALPSAVTIPLALIADTAESGDYGTLSSITVRAGRTSGTGVITTVRDEDEDDEQFGVWLASPPPSSVLQGEPPVVHITIRDDGPLRAGLTASTLRPGEGATVTLTATLNHPAPAGGVRVRFHANGEGDSPASPIGDFTLEPAGVGQHDTEWIDIAEGQRRATATLRVVNDTEPEDDETIAVWLRGSWTTDSPEIELTIPANDGGGGSGAIASIDAEPNPVLEGRNVTVSVYLTRELSADATIPLTVSRGTSEAGDHGTLASVVIPAGEIVGRGAIATVRDADYDDETFTVRLGSMPSGVRAGSESSVLVTIDDRDVRPTPTPVPSPTPPQPPAPPPPPPQDCSYLVHTHTMDKVDGGTIVRGHWHRGEKYNPGGGCNYNRTESIEGVLPHFHR